MSEHSPTPWKLAVTGYDSAGKFFFRVLEDNEPIPPELTLTAVDANGKALEEDFFVGDNWPLIVKCVNMHDAFAIACEAALSDFYHELDSQLTEPTEKMLKSVLAKAKGEA